MPYIYCSETYVTIVGFDWFLVGEGVMWGVFEMGLFWAMGAKEDGVMKWGIL